MRRTAFPLTAASVAGLTAMLLSSQSATAATFNAPVVISNFDVSEPGIDIDPRDGTLYVHGPRGIPANSVLWRSQNGGAAWTLTPSTFRATGAGGGDSDIAIAPDTGKLAWTDLWLGSATVATSTDKGDTWLTNTFQGVPVQDRQWVAATSGGNAYHVTHQLEGGLVVSRSVDGGLTYVTHSVAAAATSQGGCLCPPGNLIAESGTGLGSLTDKVGVIFTTSTGVSFARSTNSGLTFGVRTVDPTGGGSTLSSFPIVANAGGNNLVAAWLDETSTASTVMFSSSTNWGDTWATPKAIVTGGTSVFPWVDARGTKVGVSLYHTATAAKDADSVPSSAQWFVKYIESTNLGATFGTLDTADPTSVKLGPICTNGLGCGSDRELGDFQSVALDLAGKANIVYNRSVNGVSDVEVRFVKQA